MSLLRPLIGLVLLALALAPAPMAVAAPSVVDSFIGNYCLECHDSDESKAGRDFEEFVLPLASTESIITAQEIIDQVTLGEMPPQGTKHRPSDEERLALVRALREEISTARQQLQAQKGGGGSRTVLRRLSHREYERTLAVLFDRRVDTLGLTADFPREIAGHQPDTIGQSLITSGFLLDQYFQAAHRLIEARLAKPQTEPKAWQFNKHFVQYEELQGPHEAVFKFRYLCLYEQPNTDTRQGGYGHIEDFLKGVPVSGLYNIEVLAQALHRDTHYDPAIFGIDFSEPFQLGIVPGDVTKGHIHYPQAIEPLLASAVVPDGEPKWLRFQVWLEGGQTPRFIFPNGPYESRASVLQINSRYKAEFQGDVSNSGVNRAHILRQGKLPHIRISEIKINGPIPEEGGTREERAVFGPSGFLPDQAIPQLLRFAEKAFRRPLQEEDRTRVERTYQAQIAEGASPREAALDTVKMILCSPSFLYLPEVTPADETRLRPYDLASRLSYALWAQPPDRVLLKAAASGALAKSGAFRQHAERLIDNDRVEGFVHGFLDSWLRLRELGGMPPPRETNRAFYAEDLPASMKEEARRFFLHLLRENRPVTDFLHADYTFADKKLARLYNLPDKDRLRLADGFQRVSLQGVPQRGGLLGMAGVLTVSANGVETSPVTRGVWLSENILGIVPPKPPDVVPAIEPDVRGATTIRERLEKHRALQTCAECHRKIDPLGFPLENFDPIGRWRTHYPVPKGKNAPPAPKIDASGSFSSGESFTGFQDFKQTLLATRQDVFTRHLISAFLSYATGREMTPADRFEIEEILNRVRTKGSGLRSLILECLASDLFLSR